MKSKQTPDWYNKLLFGNILYNKVVISIFSEKLVKHVFDDYLGNGEVDLRLSSMSPTTYKMLFGEPEVDCTETLLIRSQGTLIEIVPKTLSYKYMRKHFFL